MSKSSFNPISGGFVPKSKGGATAAQDFPSLRADNKPAGQQQQMKVEYGDPCKGKPKEFFIYGLDQI